MKDGPFDRPPPATTTKAILTPNLPATHNVTQPNPATVTDDESKNKKSNTNQYGPQMIPTCQLRSSWPH